MQTIELQDGGLSMGSAISVQKVDGIGSVEVMKKVTETPGKLTSLSTR